MGSAGRCRAVGDGCVLLPHGEMARPPLVEGGCLQGAFGLLRTSRCSQLLWGAERLAAVQYDMAHWQGVLVGVMACASHVSCVGGMHVGMRVQAWCGVWCSARSPGTI
jgi:hypothetical protein